MQPYASVHLPNVIDFNLVYQLIESEWDEIHTSFHETLIKVTELCQRITFTLFERHFKRFPKLMELLQDKLSEELQRIEKITSEEVKEMIQIEKSSVYLSYETEPEFIRYLSMLKQERSHDQNDLAEMQLSSPNDCYSKSEADPNAFKIKEMRNSIHAYMLVAVNRFIDQCHMWTLQNFVIDFKHDFYRLLDQDYSPNSGTQSAFEVKSRMEEKPSDRKRREDTVVAIRKLKQSIVEIDNVNRT